MAVRLSEFPEELRATDAAGDYINGSEVSSTTEHEYSAHDDDMSATYSFEGVVSVVVPTIFSVIAIVGFAGNLLVIVVVACNRHMRNTTNVLMTNLAVADLIFIVICVPFTAIGYATPVWPFGDAWCKAFQYTVHATAYASVYTLVMMSFDRYLAVVHPVRSIAVRTARNASLAAALSWVLILTANYPVIIEHKTVEYTFDGHTRSACVNSLIYSDGGSEVNNEVNDGVNEEVKDWVNEGVKDDWASEGYAHNGRLYYACFFAFAYVLPLTVVSLLYGLMLRRLSRGVAPGPGREGSRSKRRVTRLVVVVVVTFAVCWLPLQLVLVVQFVWTYTDHSFQFVAAKIACSCLAYTNSCVNPILYAFLSENFRKGFRRVLCHGLCAGSGPGGREGPKGQRGDKPQPTEK